MRSIRHAFTILVSLAIGAGSFIGAITLMMAISATVRSASTAGIPPVGSAAPAFELHDLNGDIIRLADFQGRPVVLAFWADWCPDCKRAVPQLNELHDQGVAVVAINLLEPIERVRTAVRRTSMHYPVALDRGGDVGIQYGVHDIPNIFVVDENGMIVYHGYEIPDAAMVKR